MTRLLITAIGGDVAQCAARAIRLGLPGVGLIGADMHARHGGSLFVDEVSIVPAATHPSYIERLVDVCRAYAIDAVLPLSEVELTRIYETGGVGAVPVIGPGEKAVRVGGDKLLTARYIASLGWPSPRTADAAELAGWRLFPCIYKLRRGSGSKVVQLCATADELAFFASRHPNGVAQQFIEEGQEVTCAVFRTMRGEVRVLQLARRLAGGTTTWAEVIHDRATEELCRAVAEGLGVTGSINVQLKLTPAGPMVFEINPRLSSTVLMRHHLGFHDAQWSVEEFRGGATTYRPPATGSKVVRTHDAALLPAP